MTNTDQLIYQTPPEPIRQLADAPPTPQVHISTDGKMMLILEMPSFPSIEEVAAPMLRLGGLRINPANNATANRLSYTNISVRWMDEEREMPLQNLPQNARINNVTFSPDERKIAFTHSRNDGVELWIADLQTLEARQVSERLLNDAGSHPFIWHPNSNVILAQFVPENRGPVPIQDAAPAGPIIQENTGRTVQARTYQDLLQNPHDEALFDYYLTAQLAAIDISKSTFIETDWNQPALYRRFSYSPDGTYVLVEMIEKPYSYLLPVYYFPYRVQVWDGAGTLIKDLYHAPLADDVPIDFDAVPRGPRLHYWRHDQPSTLYWVEAQDDGDPSHDVPHRDCVYTLQAPFVNEPTLFTQSTFRFSAIKWGNDEIAILQERWWKTRTEKRSWINPQTGAIEKVLLERSYEDTYTDPGYFLLTRNQYHRSVLLLEDKSTFTIANGASAEGDQPFLARWNLQTNQRDILFQSRAPYYEHPVYFQNQGLLIFSREAPESAPNYYATQLPNHDGSDYDDKAITQFPDPYPALRGVSRQQVSYARKDGVTLTATLYLPRDYQKEDGPLPLVIWAYPREFKSATAAGRVKGSPYQFARLNWRTPVYWATCGYAVLDQTDMPVVGEGNAQPNDTFVEQIRQNAQAAIDYVANLGVADPQRVAVGGHSYGAFMTANLLAHTDLFAAGIARSGAYNRTLTPFGFQAEERTYWQAPEVYYQMSPFSFADKIKTPLLLIHGDADNNSGTFPMQSERFYNALKGFGATARLVILPHESHAYLARESIMHMLWEQDEWLEKFVKNK